MSLPSVVVAPFSQESFFEALECPCAVSEVAANRRVSYLLDYLREIGAKTIVVEEEYVDGDYLDDYASFYVKCFEDYPKRCKRLHFFAVETSSAQFLQIVTNRAEGTITR
ncbi:MAG: hypothetical protein ABSG02_19675, partial [Terriglobales bacterium]